MRQYTRYSGTVMALRGSGQGKGLDVMVLIGFGGKEVVGWDGSVEWMDKMTNLAT